ncbi:MAG: ribosome recycling factor [Patescibacteria group bacterium]
MPDTLTDFGSKAQKTLAHVKQDVGQLRTGRSSTSMLDPVVVEAYGTKMKLNELASLSAPDPGLLIVSPWDKSLLSSIEKAIASANLNLNPVVDGDIIRIVVAPLTEERRLEYVKQLHQKIEAGRVMMRNIRSDVRREIEALKGEAGVSEDDIDFDLENLEAEFKKVNLELDKISEFKERELLAI